jgi:molybdate transport system substrate-binding protein
MFKALLTLLLLVSTSAGAFQSRNLTIFAEQNISIPLSKIARHYSRSANVIVSLNFTSAQNLMDNIDNGEPVDLFISANGDWIGKLHQKGLVDIYNVGYIAQDKLVIAAQTNSMYLLKELEERAAQGNLGAEEAVQILNRNKEAVIIDESGNSSGFFARQFLDHLGAEDLRIFTKISEDKIPLIKAVTSNERNYSILLSSQIHNNNNFQILARSGQKIFYQALVIAGDNMEVAREFLKFLKSPEAKSHLRSHGFIVN